MHCNLRRILEVVAKRGAKTLSDIKHLAPNVRKPQTKVAKLVQSGYLEVTETGEFAPTAKAHRVVPFDDGETTE